jgi:hypothetical protein
MVGEGDGKPAPTGDRAEPQKPAKDEPSGPKKKE